MGENQSPAPRLTRFSSWGIPEEGGEWRQRAFKGSSRLTKPRGRQGGGGESFCPTLARSQGCKAAKFPNTPRRSLRERFLQPQRGLIQCYLTSQDRASSPLGNLENTNERGIEVASKRPSWSGVSLSAPPLTHPPASGPG